LIKAKLLTATGSDTDLYIGERVYEGAGTFSFTVPLGVRRIHACCIGAGGSYSGLVGDGGGGGGLAWANDIEVDPGETLTVSVGAVGYEGGDSSVKRGGTLIIEAGGGTRSGGGYTIGPDQSGGGGRGGNGGSTVSYSENSQYLGAGGGAGGYMGNGGRANQGAADEGSGAGSGGDRKRVANGIVLGGIPGGMGGGVGLNGRGATGAQLPELANSDPRDGNPGSGGNGAKFGGGNSQDGSGGGGVRIIWGIRFSYPDNADIEAV
jgi:hypothetical protein